MGLLTAAIIGGVASIGSSAIAGSTAKKGQQAAQDAADKAAAAFEGIEIPTIEEQKIILQSPELMGKYTPEQIEAMQMGVSAMEDVAARPETITEQQEALKQMSEIAEGGLTEADKAGMRQIQREVGQSDVARRRTLLNEMAQRGVLGSGMELAAQLEGQQQSASQAAEASDRAIQQAQARSLQALSQKGDIASRLRGQEFGEQSDIARAKDVINQFNLQNRQRAAEMNVTESNRAQMINLAASQAQEDTRVQAQNEMERYNQALRQQQYQNELQRASGLSSQYQVQGQTAQAAANVQAQQQAGIGSAITNIAGAIGAQQPAQQPVQKVTQVNPLGVKKEDDIYKLGASNYFGNRIV